MYIQSVPYHIGLSLRFKDKNTHIILKNTSNKIRTLYLKILVISTRNILQWPYTIFENDSFHLNFSISSENRNLELITIRFDVGHPVHV